ncbi:MAG: hypothetical protein FWE04_04140 [Oscillospiraceae bacterium]|nr:hypothetical protein [Oscillospiraceae bacterium]
MKIFKLIGSVIVNFIGIKVFNEKQKKFYRSEFFVFFAMNLTNIFVNTFIMASGGGIADVAMYNLFIVISVGITSIIQAHLAKKIGLIKAYRLGLVMFILFNLTILVLRENINDFLWLAGALAGISTTLFFVSRNMIILVCADYDQDAESVYWGAAGILNSVLVITLPVLAGLVIQFGRIQLSHIFDGMLGYYITFSLGILAFLVALAFSFRVPVLPAKHSDTNIWQDVKVLLRKKSVIYSGLGEFFRGMKDTASGFILVTLLFSSTGSEAWVGTFTMVMATCQLIGFCITARYLNLKRTKNFLLAFALTVSITPLLLLLGVELWTLFVVGGAGFLVISFQNAANVICSNAIRGYVESGFMIRELFLNVGRVFGLTFLLFMSQSESFVTIAIITLGSTQLFMWLAHSQVKFKQVT